MGPAGRRRKADGASAGALFALLLASAPAAAAPVVKEYDWVVLEDVAAPDGYPRNIIAVMDKALMSISTVPGDPYNDVLTYAAEQQFPGPELHVRSGDRLIVRVENRLSTADVTIHWHGLHMKQQAWMDGTAGVTGCAISPGETFTYNFTVDQEPGTHWWHSHAGTQYADGVFGALIIEPAEGAVDPVMLRFPYDYDQVLTVQDWLHETYHDISARYRTRIGSFTQRIPSPPTPGSKLRYTRLPFLPDYPWPSSYVLLNGRGQQDCKMRTWGDCAMVRLYGWEYFFNRSDVKRLAVLDVNGLPSGTIGQCMPERPPLFGECNPDSMPARLQCESGKRTRIRLINTGYSMPLRFWIDRHRFTVVARDGVPIEPTGPHFALVVNVGQRLDVVVECAAAPGRYKIFAMVALREFYPGSHLHNFEASSYALLEYGATWGRRRRRGHISSVAFAAKRCYEEPCVDAEVSPKHFTQAGLTEGCNVGCNYRHRIYSSWNFSSADYVPFAIEHRTRPALDSTSAASTAAVQQPAATTTAVAATARPAQERIFISVSGHGNWWNNESTAKGSFGRKFEWWSMNEGLAWNNSREPLSTPSEPVMLGRLFGRSLTDVYGTDDPARLPFVKRLRFDAAAPVTYEVVMINHEGQQHPWHLHGHSVVLVAQGWIDSDKRWRGKACSAQTRAAKKCSDDEEILRQMPALHEAVPALARLDTFTVAPRSFVVFRFTADNPGAWMMHCHMDYHLEAGLGMLWSTEDPDTGEYKLPPPPADFKVCSRGAVFGSVAARAAVALADGRARELEAAVAQATSEARRLALALALLASAVGAFAALACGAAARRRCGARAAASADASGSDGLSAVPRTLGSPATSYVSIGSGNSV